jgi:hypothetical protein
VISEVASNGWTRVGGTERKDGKGTADRRVQLYDWNRKGRPDPAAPSDSKEALRAENEHQRLDLAKISQQWEILKKRGHPRTRARGRAGMGRTLIDVPSYTYRILVTKPPKSRK